MRFCGDFLSDTPAIELAASMADYANHVATRKPIPPEAAIEALTLATDLQKGNDTPQNLISRLRAAAIKHRPAGHPMLTAQMELIADRLEYERLN